MQKGEDPISRKNNWADMAAKESVLQTANILMAIPPNIVATTMSEFPAYTEQELQIIY